LAGRRRGDGCGEQGGGRAIEAHAQYLEAEAEAALGEEFLKQKTFRIFP